MYKKMQAYTSMDARCNIYTNAMQDENALPTLIYATRSSFVMKVGLEKVSIKW
jgi:hypothetical protein